MIAGAFSGEARTPDLHELLLAEHHCEEGDLETVALVERGKTLRRSRRAARAEVFLPLPEGAVDAVMRRYGRPLEGSVSGLGGRLALESGARLSRFRYLARFDVIAKDYLLYESDDGEPLAALATSIAAALRYLAEARKDA